MQLDEPSRPIYLPPWQVCSTARYLTCALRHNLHYVFVLPEEDINWKVWPPHDLGYLRVNVWIITLAPTPRSSAQIDKRWPNSRITRTTFAIFTITTEMRVSDNKFFCESSEMHSWQKKLARVQSSEGAHEGAKRCEQMRESRVHLIHPWTSCIFLLFHESIEKQVVSCKICRYVLPQRTIQLKYNASPLNISHVTGDAASRWKDLKSWSFPLQPIPQTFHNGSEKSFVQNWSFFALFLFWDLFLGISSYKRNVVLDDFSKYQGSF